MQQILSIFMFTQAAVHTAADPEACSEGSSAKSSMLLQAHRTAPAPGVGLNVSEVSEFTQGTVQRFPSPAAIGIATNPSGAAAPLDEVGYSAVTDRCCHSEMRQFIERQVINLNYEICEEGGLYGITAFHTCTDRQDFDKMSADLLENTLARCTWIAQSGNCQPKPADCPSYPDVKAPSDCGCSRSKAATVDLAGATITNNNLGGEGPKSGPEELRYANAGTSQSGQPFDLVITALDSYTAPQFNLNGVVTNTTGTFGRLNLGRDSETNFKFAFTQVGTNTPVRLSEIHMGIFDIDGGETTGMEYVKTRGYKGYVTDPSTRILITRQRDGETELNANTLAADVSNPADPNVLSTEQSQHSAMFWYEEVTSFQMSFGITGPDTPYSRNMYFAFKSALNSACEA